MKNRLSYVKAKNLREGDWFKIAGQLYVVADVEKNLYNDLIIRFCPGALDPVLSDGAYTMIVPKSMIFKIHNR